MYALFVILPVPSILAAIFLIPIIVGVVYSDFQGISLIGALVFAEVVAIATIAFLDAYHRDLMKHGLNYLPFFVKTGGLKVELKRREASKKDSGSEKNP